MNNFSLVEFKEMSSRKDIKIYIYGAGNGFFTFKSYVLDKYEYKPSAIFDISKSDSLDVYGRKIINPQAMGPTDDPEGSVVIITIGKKSAFIEAKKLLQEKKFKKIFSSNDFYEYHACYSKLSSEEIAKKLKADENKITETRSYFEDQKSKEIYGQFLRFFDEGEKEKIHADSYNLAYMPEISAREDFSRLINCGAYNGDTIRAIYSKYGTFDAVLCFEPNFSVYLELQKYVLKQENLVRNGCFCIPAAVSDSTGFVSFNDAEGMNSLISDSGAVRVNCYKIDELGLSFRPTAIVMDIEGAEIEAISGAKNTIKTYMPLLAISCYHYPWHIYEIPYLLRQSFPEYKLYLRNYSGYTDSTIVYAMR